MASHEIPRLSVWERIGLFMRIPFYAVNGIFQNLCLLPHVILGRLSFKRSIGLSFMRANILTRRHRLFLAPTTGDATKVACQKYGLTITSEPVPSQTKNVPSAALHTIVVPGSNGSSPSSTSDETVVLYLHGGGYLYALRADGLLPLVTRVAQTAHAKRVYLLEYTVAPELKYPGQLAQTAATLSFLIGRKGVKPENIVLFGDSAGAHLALSLLAHLQQPHPEIPAVAEFNRYGPAGGQATRPSFKGALLISPWVSMNTRTPSFARNGSVDMLDAPKVRFFIDNWEPRTDEIWAELLLPAGGAGQARADFWRDLPVRSIFSTIGDWEVFLDGAREMQALLLEAGVDSKQVEGKHEIHAQLVVDSALKEPDSECTTAMLKWLGEL